ncbi:hypothetical protein P280DRAFT_553732 [Massarina eburnea CBS 473.64]|uniref:Pentapeptide repeat-containing protein n=1 Tax=Massarina eburnea CBS 473.64 TaxID=1395130 RepID=A0A6A6RJN4_9PLEO|nr:hypothetical protein P280DRAFT_553732 [Massarina eburnea CBS 473.64]
MADETNTTPSPSSPKPKIKSNLNAEAATFTSPSTVTGPVQIRAPPHEKELEEWVRSIMGPSDVPHTRIRWVKHASERKQVPKEWIVHKGESRAVTFWSIALKLFLEFESVRNHPQSKEFVVTTAPVSLWAVFCSPWAWTREMSEWSVRWDDAIRQAGVLMDGSPGNAYPTRITPHPHERGGFLLNWAKPYRCYFQTVDGRVDGFNTKLISLHVWNLRAHGCLIANSIFEDVIVTASQFSRCTFRNCFFRNVHFLNCNFYNVDFSNVTIEDSLIASTDMRDTSFSSSHFKGVSWYNNTFDLCGFDKVSSVKSSWTYVRYRRVKASKWAGRRTSKHYLDMEDLELGEDND